MKKKRKVEHVIEEDFSVLPFIISLEVLKFYQYEVFDEYKDTDYYECTDPCYYVNLQDFLENPKYFYGYFKKDQFRKPYFLWKSLSLKAGERTFFFRRPKHFFIPFKGLVALRFIVNFCFTVRYAKNIERLHSVFAMVTNYAEFTSLKNFYYMDSLGDDPVKKDRSFLSTFKNLRYLGQSDGNKIDFDPSTTITTLKLEYFVGDKIDFSKFMSLKSLTLKHCEVGSLASLKDGLEFLSINFQSNRFPPIDISSQSCLKRVVIYKATVCKVNCLLFESIESLTVNTYIQTVQLFADNLNGAKNIKKLYLEPLYWTNRGQLVCDVSKFDKLTHLVTCNLQVFPQHQDLKCMRLYQGSMTLIQGDNAITELRLDRCGYLKEIALRNLEKLTVFQCINLVSIKSESILQIKLRQCPNMGDFTSLKTLKRLTIRKDMVYPTPQMPHEGFERKDNELTVKFTLVE